MNQKCGCFFCGKDLIYSDKSEEIVCFYCGTNFSTNVKCSDGHYVCDKCHSQAANDIIEEYCIASTSTNPYEIAISVMKHPSVKMHGPEHHFLVPAALIASYYNKNGDISKKGAKIRMARKRAETVPGGSCGFHGNCGAAVGTGIFTSLIYDVTPLSAENWQRANKMTAESLLRIAKHGGPRCCKRDTYLAIDTVAKNMDWDIDTAIECDFSHLNKECLEDNCLYYHQVK